MSKVPKQNHPMKPRAQGTVNYNSPVTLKEALQIARAAAEDVVQQYDQHISSVLLSHAIYVDALKAYLKSRPDWNEAEFVAAFNEVKANYEAQRKQQAAEAEKGPEDSAEAAAEEGSTPPLEVVSTTVATPNVVEFPRGGASDGKV